MIYSFRNVYSKQWSPEQGTRNVLTSNSSNWRVETEKGTECGAARGTEEIGGDIFLLFLCTKPEHWCREIKALPPQPLLEFIFELARFASIKTTEITRDNLYQ